MMEEQELQIELYINIHDSEQQTAVEAEVTSLDLEAVVAQTLQAVHVTQPIMLSVVITDDSTIQEMNRQYREQDKPTDVLSFPLLDSPLVDAPAEQLWQLPEDDNTQAAATPAFVTPPDMLTNLGDIVISWPTIQRQAQQAGHSVSYELLFLISHGVLHLVGYDDHSEAGYQAMVQLQESVLKELGQKA